MNEQNVMTMFVVGALAMTAIAIAWGAHGHRRVRPRWVCLAIANLVLGLWLVAVGLLAGEVYFRHFLDMTDSFAMSRVHQAWLRRHWTLNKQGIRDTLQRYTLKPAPGKERVVFLGDSFTAGHGIRDVDHRFANLYRAMHAEKEVHVLAHSGWDTGDFLNCLQDFKRQGYVFGEVVLISGLNDISDIDPAWQRMTAQVKESFKPYGILQNSYLLNWLYFRMKVVTSPAFRDYGLGVQDAYAGSVWNEQKVRMRTLHDSVQSAGGRLVVVTLPFFNYPAEAYPFTSIHEQLDDFWRGEGVPHLDLLPILNGQRPKDLVVNRFDAHPNESAHKRIAHEIDLFLTGLPR